MKEIGRRLVMNFGQNKGVAIERFTLSESIYKHIKQREAELYRITDEDINLLLGTPVKYNYGWTLNELFTNPNNWVTELEWNDLRMKGLI
jgi:hypothetical protein